MEQNILFLFLLSSTALTLFPGPDILFVVSTSLAQGWKKGFLVALGLCSGLVLHTLVVVFGLGSILQALPQAIRTIELVGAAYLLFIAFRIWQDNAKTLEHKNKKKITDSLYATGFFMNLSNPKVSLFFISFFPGFLFSEFLPYNQQFLILGGIFLVQALLVFITIAFLVDRLKKGFKIYGEGNFWKKIQVLVLVGIAFVLIYP